MKTHQLRIIGRYRLVVIVAVVFSGLNAAFTTPALGQTSFIFWNPNTPVGQWSDANQWSLPVAPTTLGQAAIINDDPKASIITLDVPFITLDDLIIDGEDTIIGSGILQLLDMTNTGTIDANVPQQAIKIIPGTLDLGSSPPAFLSGDGTLTNSGTMRSSAAAGTSGGLQLFAGIYNNDGGVIEAVGSTGAAVILRPSATVNGGTLQAVGADATVNILGTSTVKVDELRADAGGLVVIDNAATVDGLKFGIFASNSGTVEIRQNATISNTQFSTTNNGQIIFKGATPGTPGTMLENVLNNGSLLIDTPPGIPPLPDPQVEGETIIVLRTALTNDGSIKMLSNPKVVSLMLEGNVTLGSNTGGTLTIAGANHSIKGTIGNEHLTHGIGHTIQGHGQIGAGLMGLTNQGILNANISGATLSVAPNSDGIINTSTGTIKATNGGRIDLVGTTTGSTPIQQDGTVMAIVDPANPSIISRVTTVNNLTLAGTGQWVADGGIIQFNSGATGSIGSLAAQNTGTVEVHGSHALTAGSVSVDGTSSFVMAIDAGSDKVTVTNNVTLAGTLDLLVDTTTFTPTYGDVFTVFTYSGGSRTGTFDQVTVNDSILAFLTGFALAPVYDFPGNSNPLFANTPFAAAPNSLALFATLPGDANLDLKVDAADLSLLLSNYGNSGAAWINGDYTGDGLVGAADLSLLLANFGNIVTGGSLSGLTGNAVVIPEPATLVLFLVGLICLSPRRTA